MATTHSARRPTSDEEHPGHRRGMTLSGVWVALAVGVPTAIALFGRKQVVDLAYLVRAGNVMLDTHHVLRADTFSFTVPGTSWLNQQWGSEVLLAAVHRLGSWPLLIVLGGIATAVTFLLVLLTCRARGASTRQAAWLTLPAVPIALGGLQVRAQMFGLVLFASTQWILSMRDRRPRSVWFLPLIALAWANLHGSFFLAPLLVGLALLEDVRRRSSTWRRLALIGLVTVAATCVGPFGPRVWGYALDVSTNPFITQFIVEWQAPSIHDAIGLFFFASVVATAVLLAVSPRRLPWTSLLALGVFLVIGLLAVRGVFWWAIAAPPLLVDALPRRSDADAPAGDRTANRLIVAFVVVAVLAALPWWRAIGVPSSEAALLDRAPVGLSSAVARLTPPGSRLFVAQPNASWFELALPDRPVFVDSRIELYPTRIWSDYADVVSGRANWDDVLRAWNVDALVVDPVDQRHLIPFLRGSADWRLAYRDQDGLVFVRAG